MDGRGHGRGKGGHGDGGHGDGGQPQTGRAPGGPDSRFLDAHARHAHQVLLAATDSASLTAVDGLSRPACGAWVCPAPLSPSRRRLRRLAAAAAAAAAVVGARAGHVSPLATLGATAATAATIRVSASLARWHTSARAGEGSIHRCACLACLHQWSVQRRAAGTLPVWGRQPDFDVLAHRLALGPTAPAPVAALGAVIVAVDEPAFDRALAEGNPITYRWVRELVRGFPITAAPARPDALVAAARLAGARWEVAPFGFRTVEVTDALAPTLGPCAALVAARAALAPHTAR